MSSIVILGKVPTLFKLSIWFMAMKFTTYMPALPLVYVISTYIVLYTLKSDSYYYMLSKSKLIVNEENEETANNK